MNQSTRLGTTLKEGMKTPVVVATTLNIALQGLPLILGVQLVACDRVLVKTQNNKSENGIYVVASGTWDRAKDFNASNDVVNGQLVIDSNSGLLYRVSFSGTIDLGVTLLSFIVAEPDSRTKTRDTVDLMLADNTIQLGDTINTVDYRSAQRGGGAPYLVKTAAQATTDGDVIDGFGNHTLATGDVVVIQGVRTLENYGCGTARTGAQNDAPLSAILDFAFAGGAIKIPYGIFDYNTPIFRQDSTNVTIIGEGIRSSILRYTGASTTSPAFQVDGIAYSLFDAFGIDVNGLCKHGFVLSDDNDTTPTVTIENNIPSIHIQGHSDATGFAMVIGPLPDSGFDFQVSENRFDLVSLENCIAGVLINGSQTINNHIDVLSEQGGVNAKQGGSTLTVLGGNTNRVEKLFSANSHALTTGTSINGLHIDIGLLYKEAIEEVIICVSDANIRNSQINIDLINVLWSDTDVNSDIILCENNTLIEIGTFILRAFTSASRGRITINPASGGSGGRAQLNINSLDQSNWAVDPGLNLTNTNFKIYKSEIGQESINNVLLDAPIKRYFRESQFGSKIDNSIEFATDDIDSIDGGILSSPGNLGIELYTGAGTATTKTTRMVLFSGSGLREVQLLNSFLGIATDSFPGVPATGGRLYTDVNGALHWVSKVGTRTKLAD